MCINSHREGQYEQVKGLYNADECQSPFNPMKSSFFLVKSPFSRVFFFSFPQVFLGFTRLLLIRCLAASLPGPLEVTNSEWMGMGVAGIIINNHYGSFPHSLCLAPVSF